VAESGQNSGSGKEELSLFRLVPTRLALIDGDRMRSDILMHDPDYRLHLVMVSTTDAGRTPPAAKDPRNTRVCGPAVVERNSL